MRYIRTKDGRIMFVQEEREQEIVAWFEGELVCVNKRKILNQSDTIEELCDEFVFIDEFFKREHRLAYSLENALARCKYHDVDITTLRGAIWTDKGLIYIAKMNEKGELELL